jgi:uncharacterized membrane protein
MSVTPAQRPSLSITGSDAHNERSEAATVNIRRIADLERQFLEQRSWDTRIGDWISRVAGSMGFAILNAIWYAVWIVINIGLIPGIEPFDPYPFTFLTLCVSLEAIFLSVFVLMSQNRSSRMDTLRNHLDLQIDMLAEEENTRSLRLLTQISRRLGIDPEKDDPRMSDLTEDTAIEDLVEGLEQDLPNEA